MAFAVGFLFQKLAANKESEIERLGPDVQEKNSQAQKFDKVYSRLKKTESEAAQIATWMQQRYYWADFLSEMRRVLLRGEESIRMKFAQKNPSIDAGLWIEQLVMPYAAASTSPEPAATNPKKVITLICRAVDLTKVSGDADASTSIVSAAATAIKSSPMVDPNATALVGQVTPDESNNTFTFTINVTLLNPPTF